MLLPGKGNEKHGTLMEMEKDLQFIKVSMGEIPGTK